MYKKLLTITIKPKLDVHMHIVHLLNSLTISIQTLAKFKSFPQSTSSIAIKGKFENLKID